MKIYSLKKVKIDFWETALKAKELNSENKEIKDLLEELNKKE